jgi:hypothetical protein
MVRGEKKKERRKNRAFPQIKDLRASLQQSMGSILEV